MKPILLVTVIAAALAMAFSTSASSYSLTNTGSPGATTTPFTYATYGAWGSTITVPWRTVYESPSYRAYDQYVCVTPRLWSIQYGTPARWVKADSRTNCQWIRGSASAVNVNGADFAAVPLFGYSVDVQVTWQLSNGQQIASQVYDYNVTNDYRCTVVTPKCIIAMTTWGGGAYLMFDY
jgi:hypothetical protein